MNKFLQMQSFTAVAEAGSFVGAAEALGLSKAAVSRHVSELEDRLGVRLLQRTTRRQSLTEEGQIFLSRSQELLSNLAEAEDELSSHGNSAQGLLRVNAPVSFGIRKLAPLWGAFQQNFPKTRLEISLADRQVDLVEEGYDVAVRIGKLADSTLISRRLAEVRIILCASPTYLASTGHPAHPDELARHRTIGYSYWTHGNLWSFTGPSGTQTVRVNPSLMSNNGETCTAAAIEHQGITMQPDFLIAEELQAGRLVELLPDYRIGTAGVHAIYPSRKHVTPKVRALVRFLATALNPQAQ